MNDYESQLNSIKEAQTTKLKTDLAAAKEATLSDLLTQQQTAEKTATASKEAKNIASQVNKLNYAEFMANRGQTSAGVAQTAELARQNVLARDVGNIESQKASSLETINKARNTAETSYQTGIVSGQASIESDIATKLLAYKEQLRQEAVARQEAIDAYNRQVEEQKRQEEIRQRYAYEQYQWELEKQRQLAAIESSKNNHANELAALQAQLAAKSNVVSKNDSTMSAANAIMNRVNSLASTPVGQISKVASNALANKQKNAINTISLQAAGNFNNALSSAKKANSSVPSAVKTGVSLW